MYYTVSAYNTQAIIVWASDERDVVRYVDWLNRNRNVNHYQYSEADDQAAHDGRDDVLSMDEPYWDDFMEDEA